MLTPVPISDPLQAPNIPQQLRHCPLIPHPQPLWGPQTSTLVMPTLSHNRPQDSPSQTLSPISHHTDGVGYQLSQTSPSATSQTSIPHSPDPEIWTHGFTMPSLMPRSFHHWTIDSRDENLHISLISVLLDSPGLLTKQTAYQPIHPLPRPSRTVATDPTKTTRNATEVSPLAGSSHDAAETTGFQSLPSESGRLAVCRSASAANTRQRTLQNSKPPERHQRPPTAARHVTNRQEPRFCP